MSITRTIKRWAAESARATITDKFGKFSGSVKVEDLLELIRITPGHIYLQTVKTSPNDFRSKQRVCWFKVPVIGQVCVEITDGSLIRLKRRAKERGFDWRKSHVYSKKIAIIQAIRSLILDAEEEGKIHKFDAENFAFNADMAAREEEQFHAQSKCIVTFMGSAEACDILNAPVENIEVLPKVNSPARLSANTVALLFVA